MAGRLSTGVQNLLAGIEVEMVSNGGFDTALTGWGAVTATQARVGTGGVANGPAITVGVAAGYSANTTPILCVPGHTYRLKYNYLGTNDAVSGYPQVKVGNAPGDATYYNSGSAALTATALTEVTAYFTVPFDAATQDMYISLGCTGTDVQLFDGISLVDIAHSLKEIFRTAEIRFYTGTQPTDPDNTALGTLLCTVKNYSAPNYIGVTWRDAVDGVIGKANGETWQGVCGADGQVGWFRVCLPNDPGGYSITAPRADGAVATSGAQINFPTLSFVATAIQSITDLTLTVKIQA